MRPSRGSADHPPEVISPVDPVEATVVDMEPELVVVVVVVVEAALAAVLVAARFTCPTFVFFRHVPNQLVVSMLTLDVLASLQRGLAGSEGPISPSR